MNWPVQDAKARFSALLETALSQGPQIVTRRGVEAAVLVPIEEWRRLKESSPRSLQQLLLAPGPRWKMPDVRDKTLCSRPVPELD